MQDKPDAKPYEPASASIEFDNVSFEYSVGMLVLDRVSFRVAGGKTLALVGATGSGKSSCLRLLFRFYDPTSGDCFLLVRLKSLKSPPLHANQPRSMLGCALLDGKSTQEALPSNIQCLIYTT